MATTVDVNSINQDAYSSIIDEITSSRMSQEQVLKSISTSLKTIAVEMRSTSNPRRTSQSTFRDQRDATYDEMRNARNERRRNGRIDRDRNAYDDEIDFTRDLNGRQRSRQFTSQIDRFADSFGASLMKGLSGASLSDRMTDVVREFADDLGVSVVDLGQELGDQLGQMVADQIKQSDFGRELGSELDNLKDQFTDSMRGGLRGISDAINNGGGITDVIRGFGQGSGISGILSSITSAYQAGGISNAVGAIVELGVNAASANYALLALAAATYVIDKFSEALEYASKGAKSLWDAMVSAANRQYDSAEKRLDNYKKRLKADYDSYVREPFEILKDAANTAIEAWNNVASQIAQTQGYDKAGLQDLWSNYAQRLQKEGLSSVVSSADILTNLQQVLKAGLSGQVAEEFSYIATVLNNAIPTEDFFSYASTYASVAANAIKNGKSQTEAIQEANSQLEQFASNLLYSSRQLAGGFTTGLTNASQLFEAANNIAVAAHTGNAAEISGVLTSVSAIVGAIAPDLTSSIVSVVTSAATGGNSSQLTALRSLAGTGASNTAFLQALAKDPQAVFEELFMNLAQMQNMYGDNYMEVAESLANTFGMSIDALSRVDFGYLAQAVKAMDVNNSSLEENLALLASGNTTLTKDQLRIQQINEYMIDEGLSYVLDNEVARAIQEHMWEEQLANEIMENEYAVNLNGAGLDFLQGLKLSVDNIFTLLNPLGWTKKVSSLIVTKLESNALDDEIREMLEKGNLGSSHPDTLYKLAPGKATDLKLTKRYIELLGGTSSFSALQTFQSYMNAGVTYGIAGLAGNAIKRLTQNAILSSREAQQQDVTSSYKWSTIGKSITQSLFTTGNKALYNSSSAYEDINLDPQSVISSKAAKNMQAYLDTMQTFVDEGKSYEEWVESAKEYGYEDLGAALEDYGISEVEAAGKFQEMEAVKAAQYQHERDLKEEQFWDDMIKWAEQDFPLYTEKVYEYYEDIMSKEDMLITNTDLIIGELETSNKKLKEFYDQWIDYYVNHTAYHRDTLNAHEIEAIKTAEAGETGDAVFALAQALTDNLVNLQDPQVQTNAILSQMLLVVEAIFQLQNNTTTVSIPTALASLGLGTTSVDNQY